jgi:hypothetical protein
MPKILIALLAALLAALAMTEAAGATQPRSASGRIGPVVIPQATCEIRSVVGTHSLFLPAPAIYAPNTRAGAGNDAAYVRWYTLLTDTTGKPIQMNLMSAWSRASDDRPAPYSGSQSFRTLNRFNSVYQYWIGHGLMVLVQWYDNAGRVTGTATYDVTSFKLVDGQVKYDATSCV